MFCERDAAPEAHWRTEHGRCGGVPGMFCEKKREANPEPHWHTEHGRCGGVPGMFCEKKRDRDEILSRVDYCSTFGADCAKKREAHWHTEHGRCGGVPGMFCERDAPSYPPGSKADCLEEGGECHTMLKIQEAIKNVKQDSENAKDEKNIVAKHGHCSKKGAECSPLTEAHLYAAKNNPKAAREAEAECFAAGGICARAQRDFDDLERRVDAAVAAIQG
jgi:hypothetical protein